MLNPKPPHFAGYLPPCKPPAIPKPPHTHSLTSKGPFLHWSLLFLLPWDPTGSEKWGEGSHLEWLPNSCGNSGGFEVWVCRDCSVRDIQVGLFNRWLYPWDWHGWIMNMERNSHLLQKNFLYPHHPPSPELPQHLQLNPYRMVKRFSAVINLKKIPPDTKRMDITTHEAITWLFIYWLSAHCVQV